MIIYKHFRQLFTGPDQPREMLRPLTKNSNPIQHQRGTRKDKQRISIKSESMLCWMVDYMGTIILPSK